MELKDYLSVFKRQIKLIIVITFVVTLTAFLVTLIIPVSYKTSVSFLISRADRQKTEDYQFDGYYTIQASELFANTVVGWCKTPSITSEVYKKAGFSASEVDIKDLSKKFKAKKTSSQIVEVQFIQKNEQEANNLVYALINTLEEQTNIIYQKKDQDISFEIIASSPVLSESHPNTVLNVLIGFLSGLFFSILLAFGWEYFSKTLNSKKQIREILNIPVAGIISKKIENILPPDSKEIRDFQFLRSYLIKDDKNLNSKKIILVTGSESDNLSLVSANLALSFAFSGKKTLLVDVNIYNNSSICNFFKCSNLKGFNEFVKNPLEIDKYIQETNRSKLKILPAGKNNLSVGKLANNLAQANLEKVALSLKQKADIIIINSPSFKEGIEFLPLSQISDQLLVKIKIGKVKVPQLEEIKRFLDPKKKNQYLVIVE